MDSKTEAEIIKQTEAFVRDYMSRYDCSHDYLHVERVVRQALELAAQESMHTHVDMVVVHLAALLHDVDDAKYSDASTSTVGDFLATTKLDTERAHRIVRIIDAVSFRKELLAIGQERAGTMDADEREWRLNCVELSCVQDADRLDAIGAFGVMRCAAFSGVRNRPLHNPRDSCIAGTTYDKYVRQDSGTAVAHFYEKLLQLASMMKTEGGKREAKGRHEFMCRFLEQVDAEAGFGADGIPMEHAKEAGLDQQRDSDNAGQADPSHSNRRMRSNSSSYDGDDSDPNNDGDNDDGDSHNEAASDHDEWTPVVTFAEAPKKSPHSSRLRLSSGLNRVGAGHRTQSAIGLDSVHRRVMRTGQRRTKRVRPPTELSAVHSASALNEMQERGTHADTPLNTPAPVSATPGITHTESLSVPNRYEPSRRSASLYTNDPEYLSVPSDRLTFPAGDEPSSSESSGSSEAAVEELWLRRARTFSVQNGGEPVRSPGSIRTLPRVLTVASAREKDDFDQPAMRIGREATNDLRNIQLTFSRNEAEQPSNPLKRLIRSKHNFRALVTYGGYLIPINILLNVILLGRGWLQFNEPDASGERHTVNNPIGYLITSVISLVLIVASGVCFILRCLEFDVMITTVSSVVANFVNAVLILASAIMYLKTERPLHPDARLTGEYYCSYAGAAVALLNALLLLLDILVTPGFRYRGSGMSRPQRLLQFNIIVVVVWIGIGGYVWSKIEGWDTITSIMFCMVTITTIGFGNITPSKDYSRILQLFYGPMGILMFGLMLLNTRNVIIQITRTKFRTAKRDFEAKRRKIEQELTAEHVKRRLQAHPERRGWRAMCTDMLGRLFLSHNQRVRVGIPHWLRRRIDNEDVDAGNPNISAPMSATAMGEDLVGIQNITFAEPGSRAMSTEPASTQGSNGSTDVQDGGLAKMQGDDSVSVHNLDSVSMSGEDPAPHTMPRTYTTASRLSQVREVMARPGKLQNVRQRMHRRRKPRRANSDNESDTDSESDTGLDITQVQDSPKPGPLDRVLTAASNVRDRVKARKHGRSRYQRRTHEVVKQLWAALIINVSFWLVSSAIFYVCERPRWNYFDAMWFCYVAFTTIGYGDYVPLTTEGMVAFICLCFVAVGLETFLVVSGVTFFTDLLGRAMRRSHVQRRIATHRKSLAAYEIRRHIKHPQYNPFSTGDDENMVKVGVRRLRRWLQHMGDMLRGRRSVTTVFTRHRTRDQRERDERLTEGFIRHTTGMGGFATTTWQPPSRPTSVASLHAASGSVPSHVPTAPHTAVSMPSPDIHHDDSSAASNRSASISSAPEDFLWALF
ncbi:hypothetical protein IWW49_000425 [Coemansia sp. RSA 1797]|nr:hypothetical protein IWW49_000425 [Coemansia sp. RSA 1797]